MRIKLRIIFCLNLILINLFISNNQAISIAASKLVTRHKPLVVVSTALPPSTIVERTAKGKQQAKATAVVDSYKHLCLAGHKPKFRAVYKLVRQATVIDNKAKVRQSIVQVKSTDTKI